MKINQAWPEFLHDFIHLYGRDKSTGIHYTTAKNSLVRFLGDIDVGSITPTLVSDWSRHLEIELKPGTINVYLDALASFGKWARKRGLTDVDWFDGIKRKDPEAPIPKALRWAEALVVADNCWGKRLSMRDRLLMLFLLNTGCRASEAVQYPVHQVDMVENKVIFTNTKGRVARVVYFGPKFKLELETYLAWRAGMWPDSYWLFPTKSGDRMTVEDAQSIPSKYILGITLHQMRHTFITHALKRTKNLKLVQELAGHKSLLTTARYLRIWHDEKQQAAVCIEGEEGEHRPAKRRRVRVELPS